MNLDHEKGHRFKTEIDEVLGRSLLQTVLWSQWGGGGLAEGGAEMDFNHCTVFPRNGPVVIIDLPP